MEWMQRALELARQAAIEDEVPVGAVIVRGEGADAQIVGSGRNQRESLQSALSHAELHALDTANRRLGSWRLSECDLYVTLEPCPMCLAACQQARIRRVIYGAPDPKGGAISLGYSLHSDTRLNHRFEVRHESNAQCGAILSEFFRKKRQAKRDQ